MNLASMDGDFICGNDPRFRFPFPRPKDVIVMTPVVVGGVLLPGGRLDGALGGALPRSLAR